MSYFSKKEFMGMKDAKVWTKLEKERRAKAEEFPLPSQRNTAIWFNYTPEMMGFLSELENERGFLSSLKMPAHLVKHRFLAAKKEEAYFSSRIEGAVSSLSEALLAMDKPKRNYRDESLQMIVNNKKALDFFGELKSKPLSHDLIWKLQEILIFNTHKEKPITVGAYRKGPIYVVDGMGRAVYEGPPAKKVPEMMDRFVRWFNAKGDLHPILAAGFAHLYFVHVHPFDDGNGRSARAVSNLALAQRGYDFIHFLSPSSYFDHHKSAYYGALRNVDAHDYDATYFLLYYLEALVSEIRRVKSELLAQQVVGDIKEKLSATDYIRLNKRQIKALNFLIRKNEALTTTLYCKLNRCSDEAARKDFNQLLEMRILNALGEGRARKYIFF